VGLLFPMGDVVVFIAGITAILNCSRLLSSLYGRFLAEPALKEDTVYLY